MVEGTAVQMRRFPGPFTLHSLSRWMGWVAILVAVVLIGFLISAAVYASEIRYEGFSPPAAQSTGHNMALFTSSVTMSNPGPYPIQGFQFEIHLLQPSGDLVATGYSPASTLGAGATSVVPVYVPVDMASGPILSLITKDTTLHAVMWLNATYASLFQMHAVISEDYLWGAPFAGLNLTVGAPATGPNGTTTFPVNLSFVNHSPLPLDGTLRMAIFSAGGAMCGEGNLTLGSQGLPVVAPGASFTGTTSLTDAAGCQPTTLDLTYVNPLMNVVLPVEVWP